MRIADPMPFLGIDSGLRTLTVTKAEAATLLRAAAILDRGHDLIDHLNPDHQGDGEYIGDALCMAPIAIRALVTEGFDVTGWEQLGEAMG